MLKKNLSIVIGYYIHNINIYYDQCKKFLILGNELKIYLNIYCKMCLDIEHFVYYVFLEYLFK